MSKYDPLREHLAHLDDVVWAAKLVDLEAILGSDLPKSAREHRTWWANSGGSLVHQNAWLDAGWRVERTDLPRDVVVFRRLRIGGTALAQSQDTATRHKSESRRAGEGALARVMPDLRQPVTVTLRAEWTPIGEVHKLPCSSATIPAGCGIVRIVFQRQGVTNVILVDTEAVQPFYRSLRLDLKSAGELNEPPVANDNGADASDASAGNGVLKKLGLLPNEPMEVDVVQAGNAWLLTDGRGRKADLELPEERALVAQLLLLQARQSALKARLVKR
ncbi:hypothetical protein [Roseibium sp.]|uniref:DUF7662 domain-containing protein n=1 Tax=Roseibium sp. TaxID=1936156 RepID=UPI003A978DF8